MSILYRKWYTLAMSYYDDIYEVAADDYGLVSSATAQKMGVPAIELVKLAKRGRLIHVGRGLYRLARYVPTPYDSYAEAVALVGPEAYLFGESVIAMHGLAPTNPKLLYVATPKRIRKTLPDHIVVVHRDTDEKTVRYEGIASQSVFDAIRSCKGMMMPERLRDAADRARREGLVTRTQHAALSEEAGR